MLWASFASALRDLGIGLDGTDEDLFFRGEIHIWLILPVLYADVKD